jgi:hypothetical protein
MPFDRFLSRLSAKDKLNVERHITACETGPYPGHADLWKRLVSTLSALAPVQPTSMGQHAFLFFIADGKYRMQVFAIEDQRQGTILVYVPDVLKQAMKEKIIKPAGGEEEDLYTIAGGKGETLRVELLDAANTANPAAHFKNMLGWNRKALRVTLSVGAVSSAQIAAVENLCTTASGSWATADVK